MKQNLTDEQITKSLLGTGLEDYMQYIKSPWRIFWSNLVAGVMRGFGFILGVTVVLAVFIWIISQLTGVPFVGEYFEQAQTAIDEYAENTNYKEEFQQINANLEELNKKLPNLGL